MRVETSDARVFDVSFHKIHRQIKNKKRDLIDTKCVISEVFYDNNLKPSFKDVASGKSFHNPVDRYNKYTGKKFALRRALNEMNISGKDKGIIALKFEDNFKHCRK